MGAHNSYTTIRDIAHIMGRRTCLIQLWIGSRSTGLPKECSKHDSFYCDCDNSIRGHCSRFCIDSTVGSEDWVFRANYWIQCARNQNYKIPLSVRFGCSLYLPILQYSITRWKRPDKLSATGYVHSRLHQWAHWFLFVLLRLDCDPQLCSHRRLQNIMGLPL